MRRAPCATDGNQRVRPVASVGSELNIARLVGEDDFEMLGAVRSHAIVNGGYSSVSSNR
jgi:hypothetical protein